MSADSQNRQESEHVDFVSAMMHELKTSLTAIIASAELIADDLNLDEDGVHWKLIQSIIRNAHRLDDRVTLLAEMPRAQMQEFQFRPEPVDVAQIIHDVVAQFHPRIQSRRQSLTLDVPDSLPTVTGDRKHLEQVLLMLLANASNFSPENSSISVTARYDKRDGLVTRITDSCGGIPAEEQERIFQPHYQINRTDGRGGLGLTIARFLVELHGGQIWLESHPGQGCSFFFSIPS